MESQTKNLQLKLGGLSCSFCAQNIEKLFEGGKGVENVSVSLAHNEMLAVYDPRQITSKAIKDRIRQMGYKIHDPDKTKAFEQEAEELHRKKIKLITAGILAGLALIMMVVMWLGLRLEAFKWIMLALALATMLGPGLFILKMAFQSLRRGILNQHVLLEFGA